MDPLINKYSVWKRILHKFQSRRDIPFRRKWFIGYDLHGNTYWEFTIDRSNQRLRRKMEPYIEYMFKVDYFNTVPPQWLQWLRRTRETPPTLSELVEDQVRQQNIKVLAKLVDEKWMNEKLRLEQQSALKLQSELDKVKVTPQDSPEKQKFKDPWAEADKSQNDPIHSANITSKR